VLDHSQESREKSQSLEKMICLVSGCRNTAERHHLKTRGSGGTDDDWNILHICRTHHVEIHAIGFVRFFEKYPNIQNLVESRGWKIENIFGKQKLVRK
jgi:hypothetical protein